MKIVKATERTGMMLRHGGWGTRCEPRLLVWRNEGHTADSASEPSQLITPSLLLVILSSVCHRPFQFPVSQPRRPLQTRFTSMCVLRASEHHFSTSTCRLAVRGLAVNVQAICWPRSLWQKEIFKTIPPLRPQMSALIPMGGKCRPALLILI